MESRTRQRLVGVVLLLILVAVLAPLLFRSPDQVRNALDMNIPEPPAMPTVEVTPPVDRETRDTAAERIAKDRETAVAQAEKTLDNDPEPVSGTPSDPADADNPDTEVPSTTAGAEAEPVLAGYVVQVGSFSQPANARALVEKLKAAGYRAYRKSGEGENGERLERVMVGPDIRKEDAQRTRRRLESDSRFSLQGLVRAYVP